MGIAKIIVLLCLAILLPSLTMAQNCNQSIKKGLQKGKTYLAECDSMILLNKKAYEDLYNKLFYYEAIIYKQEKLDSLMRAESKAKDILIKNMDEKTEIQANGLKEYKTKLDTLLVIANKSLVLNDQTLNTLEKEKRKNKLAKASLLGISGACLFLLGIVAAGAL